MKRKIIELGHDCMVVSLPKKWITATHVKKGDEIDIVIDNNTLIINSNTPLAKEENIDIAIDKGTLGYVKSVVNNLYRKGYDEVTITYQDTATKNFIVDALNETMGFEIVEQKEHSCKIRNVAGLFETEFENLMRRSFLITLTIADESLEDIQKKSFDAEKYTQLKRTVEKLMNVCCRTLNKGTLRNLPTSKFKYLIVHTIDKLAYAYYYIILFANKNKYVLKNKKLIAYYAEVNQYLRAFYTEYYAQSTKNISSLTHKKDELLWKQGYALTKVATFEERIILHHLMEIIRRTYECTSPLLGERL